MPQVLPAPLPEAPLLALAGRWDLRLGEHPDLAAPLADVLAKLPLFPTLQEWQELSTLGLPIGLAGDVLQRGHHVLLDNGPLSASGADADVWPLAPVFVRDLCGRVIHTGLLPLPLPPSTPTFPTGCADVPASMGGAEYLEEALLTHFTRLEIAPAAEVKAAGEHTLLRAAYAHPAKYPYKLRPLTFYADGWRLPQLNRVFARRVEGAEAKAQDLMQRWAARPNGQDYEAFYEAMGGATKVEELFLQGVTLIPTLEAYNGAFQVAEDFTLQGVEAGRAVAGLHVVTGQEAGPLPQGTIVRVLAPGFVTTSRVEPAQVVVSSGPNGGASLVPDDAPLPNLALPHPHVGPSWGACWLPTKPQHFVAPAIWDWQPNGHFVQVEGPLWCPQHYVYGSTASIVRATRKPIAVCPGLLQVPPVLKTRFAPAVALTSYDTINERTKAERSEQADHPLQGSALDNLPLATQVAPLGFHPLPRSWPQLTQAAWFPGLGGAPAACPATMASRLAPIAAPQLGEDVLAKHHVATSEPLRTTLQACTAPAATDKAAGWLPEIPASQLQLNVKRLFANRTYRTALTMRDGALPGALFRFKEKALAWRRLRYRLATKYPAALTHAEGHRLSLDSAEALTHALPESAHAADLAARQQALTRVPAPNAPAFQPPKKPVKLKRKA